MLHSNVLQHFTKIKLFKSLQLTGEKNAFTSMKYMFFYQSIHRLSQWYLQQQGNDDCCGIIQQTIELVTGKLEQQKKNRVSPVHSNAGHFGFECSLSPLFSHTYILVGMVSVSVLNRQENNVENVGYIGLYIGPMTVQWPYNALI